MGELHRYRATLAYDGTAYQGFQRQAAGVPTVQATVEQAISRVTGLEISLWAAGRTDTGVHATGQVIAFDAAWGHEDVALLRAVNANLPEDIALQDLCQHPGFHPRFDALSRVYRYTVLRAAARQPLLARYSWQVRQPLDLAQMQQAAGLLVGEHDFASFGQPPQGENTVRVVFASHWQMQHQPYGEMYVYEIEATAFLYHMVRRITGMLVNVGRGWLAVAEFDKIFRQADVALAKGMAPPQGLVLAQVRYPIM